MDTDALPGPLDSSVLSLQQSHVSVDIWDGPDPHVPLPVFRRNDRTLYVDHFILDHRVVEVLVRCRFHGILYLGRLHVDNDMVTALAERWRQETHTFHLPVGEASVTLQDVQVFTGLPVDGRPVTIDVPDWTDDEWRVYCHRLLGYVPDQDSIDTRRFHLASLAQHFQILGEDATEEDVHRYARAYILILLGGALFCDTKSTTMKFRYLLLLEDIDAIPLYSWGSAVLAYQYRGLCAAAKRGYRSLCGYALLLQVWAWERLPLVRPSLQDALLLPRVHGQPALVLPPLPRGFFWCRRTRNTKEVCRDIRAFRQMFDALQLGHFVWVPYATAANPFATVSGDGYEVGRDIVTPPGAAWGGDVVIQTRDDVDTEEGTSAVPQSLPRVYRGRNPRMGRGRGRGRVAVEEAMDEPQPDPDRRRKRQTRSNRVIRTPGCGTHD